MKVAVLRVAACSAAATALAAAALAQTTDPLFRSWEWAEEPHSVRGAALAGAIAADPSGASTALLQPGGLSLVSERDIRLSVRYAGTGSIGIDTAQSRWSLGEVSYAQPLGLRFGLGAYHYTRRAIDVEIDGAALPPGVGDDGDLSVQSRETGVAFGMTLTPRLRLGVRVGISHLDLEGQAVTGFEDGSTRETRTSIEASRPRLGIGLVFSPNQRFQAGVVYDSRTHWSGTVATEGEERRRTP